MHAPTHKKLNKTKFYEQNCFVRQNSVFSVTSHGTYILNSFGKTVLKSLDENEKFLDENENEGFNTA